MDLNKMRIDSEKEVDGIWINLDDTTSFKIARWDNPKYKTALQIKVNPYLKHRSLENTTDILTGSKGDSLMNAVIAKTIIKDWKGLLNKGKEVLYSEEEAYKLLENKEFQPIRQHIIEIAQDQEQFRVDEIAKTTKKP